MTERLTPEELDKKYPGWREGRSKSPAMSPHGRRTPTTTLDAAADRLSAFLDLIKILLERGLDVRLEHRFKPPRRWRADLAILEPKVILEIEGGMYVAGGGAHQRVSRYKSDMEKYNVATAMGWKVLRVGWEHVKNGQALNLIESTLTQTPVTKRRRKGG